MNRTDVQTLMADLPTRLLDGPAEAIGSTELTNGMLITWLSRPDLQRAFDLESADGRSGLRRWCIDERRGRTLRQRLVRSAIRAARPSVDRGDALHPGVNLIGYLRGVLGMGEHVRMSAEAIAAARVPGGIVDFTLGLGRRRQKVETGAPKLSWPKFRCNLFHINADQMMRTYWHLGEKFFAGRYNIGFWAWELARWPDSWVALLGTVDEVWAPSRFIRDALEPVTAKPVTWMPLCVELPTVAEVARSEFGASSDEFLYVFTFDGHSYFERKNPVAIVRAFRSAFPGTEKVRLIIKAMNADACKDRWIELLSEARADDRIVLIDATWPRHRVLSLVQTCDAYVSLHRSEGFGRSPAEAMLLGKPVIVTDYSGTADFCRTDNALLVDYSLVAVAGGSYVDAAGQVWAEPSIECAARHMRVLYENRALGPKIGANGRRTIAQEFNARTVGERYRARLNELDII